VNTKLVFALVAIGVLAVAVVGLVSAQIVTSNTTRNTTTPNAASNGGFFCWVGRCFGFGGPQAYRTQAPAYQTPLPANITVTDPNTGQTTTYPGYYGYGGCMRGYYP
jgi:hypothetical protein